MRVVHRLTIRARCPMDRKPDTYEAEITTDRTIPVEHILKAICEIETVEAFQEEITVQLARTLGARVRTVGFHSGIQTEVIST